MRRYDRREIFGGSKWWLKRQHWATLGQRCPCTSAASAEEWNDYSSDDDNHNYAIVHVHWQCLWEELVWQRLQWGKSQLCNCPCTSAASENRYYYEKNYCGKDCNDDSLDVDNHNLIIMKLSGYIGRVWTKDEKNAMITVLMLVITILVIMNLHVLIGRVWRRKETGEFVGRESYGV